MTGNSWIEIVLYVLIFTPYFWWVTCASHTATYPKNPIAVCHYFPSKK